MGSDVFQVLIAQGNGVHARGLAFTRRYNLGGMFQERSDAFQALLGQCNG